MAYRLRDGALAARLHAAREMSWRLQRRQFIHQLHIGKTGGTAVKAALSEHLVSKRRVIRLHTHEFRLRDVPHRDLCFFFLRDPVSRFVSGFNSRKREGRPRNLVPHSERERWAFSRFESADELGLALSSDDARIRADVRRAMQSIRHVNSSFYDWFESDEYFLSRRRAILFVGFQESLDRDFARLCALLDISGARLPSDEVAAHRTPAGMSGALSGTAIENLRRWYERDFSFLSLCRREFVASEQA